MIRFSAFAISIAVSCCASLAASQKGVSKGGWWNGPDAADQTVREDGEKDLHCGELMEDEICDNE